MRGHPFLTVNAQSEVGLSSPRRSKLIDGADLLPYYKRLKTRSDTDSKSSTGARMSSELEIRTETTLIHDIPYSVGENDTTVCIFPCRTSENDSGPGKWPSFRHDNMNNYHEQLSDLTESRLLLSFEIMRRRCHYLWERYRG